MLDSILFAQFFDQPQFPLQTLSSIRYRSQPSATTKRLPALELQCFAKVQPMAVSYTSCLFHALRQCYGHHTSRPSRSPTLYNYISKPPSTKSSFCRHIRTSQQQPVICPRELVSFAYTATKDAVNPPRFCRRSRPNIVDFAELLVRQALPVVVTTPIPAGLVVANYALSLYHH